jgi:Family of unknown function (DUF6166)
MLLDSSRSVQRVHFAGRAQAIPASITAANQRRVQVKKGFLRREYIFARVPKAAVDENKVYHGRREMGNAIVTVNDQRPGHRPRLLRERQDLENHSPTGFEWGYGGSGPAQLALALLADYLGNDEQALALHQDFKFEVIAGLPHDSWKLTGQDMDKALKRITQQ